jgi:hypothetical protein
LWSTTLRNGLASTPKAGSCFALSSPRHNEQAPRELTSGACYLIANAIFCGCETQALDTTQPYQTQWPAQIKGQKMPKQVRIIRIFGDVAYVPLTQGYEAIIDAADVPLLDGFNWASVVKRGSVYARRKDYTGNKHSTIYLHRVLMGDPDGLQVDHYDSDGLNNRRDNLRIATASQNMHNRRISRNNTSGFKGVHRNKVLGKWAASIMTNRKRKHLGFFTSPEEAHAAYCRASEKYHGEFGRTS